MSEGANDGGKNPKTDIEEAVEELIEDPDAPERGDAARPPQTVDAEPAPGDRP